MAQITNHILMVRPYRFGYNPQTAVNNYYQKPIKAMTADEINEQAKKEFDDFVSLLENNKVNVMVVHDTAEDVTPDSVFPNNWVTFHEDGKVILYPLFAINRRRERRKDIIEEYLPSRGFVVNKVVDFTFGEDEDKFLEATGSMIFDRVNRIIYASLSDRTDAKLLQRFCHENDYQLVSFTSNQTVNNERLPIYHTNVMMCLGEGFVVICLDAIDDLKERDNVIKHLESSGKEIITITEFQVSQFAGNMLQVLDVEGKPILVMSTSAYESLNPEQLQMLEKHAKIIHSSIDTIETCGGGSVRCMMAEVFLPRN